MTGGFSLMPYLTTPILDSHNPPSKQASEDVVCFLFFYHVYDTVQVGTLQLHLQEVFLTQCL